MKHKQEVIGLLRELESDFNDRIVEYNKMAETIVTNHSMKAEAHAFCYYREQLWEIERLLEVK